MKSNRDFKDLFVRQNLTDRVGKLAKNEVHLWGINRINLGDIKNYSDYFLDNDEQARAQKFHFRRDHDMFVLGRYFTKTLLACYTQCRPASIKIVPDTYGKPVCELNLFFNISHSGDQLLLGFSNSEIGVDIEEINPSVNLKSIGESHFSVIEFQRLMRSARDQKVEMFFDIWTKKESVIKGIGKGLSIPLKEFNVTNPNGEVLWDYPNQNQYGNWYVQNIEARQGFKSALASKMEFVDFRYFKFDEIHTVLHC